MRWASLDQSLACPAEVPEWPNESVRATIDRSIVDSDSAHLVCSVHPLHRGGRRELRDHETQRSGSPSRSEAKLPRTRRGMAQSRCGSAPLDKAPRCDSNRSVWSDDLTTTAPESKSGIVSYPTYRNPNTVESPLFDPLPILIRDPAVPVSLQYRFRVLALGDIKVTSLGLLRVAEHVAVEERFLHEPRAEVDTALLPVSRDVGG